MIVATDLPPTENVTVPSGTTPLEVTLAVAVSPFNVSAVVVVAATVSYASIVVSARGTEGSRTQVAEVRYRGEPSAA